MPIRRQPINKQPESCSAKLSSKHSTSYIVKEQRDPLNWTALRGTSPRASCPLLRKAERWPVAGWGDGRQPGRARFASCAKCAGDGSERRCVDTIPIPLFSFVVVCQGDAPCPHGAGLSHHVTQRGSRRETIFFEDGDHDIYRDLLAEQTRKAGVEVWAYCLMPNRVHLILTPTRADDPVAFFVTNPPEIPT